MNAATTPARAATSLREGYSTGACAAALCVAVWRKHCGEILHAVSLLFPDGQHRVLPLASWDGDRASLIKNAGDDPDCTHGARLYASLTPCSLDAAQAEDYILPVGTGHLILHAVEGIGLCTRPGLDCEQGKWAINRVPRHMIADNLCAAGCTQGVYRIELGVVQGEILAQHTLNAQLGVLGGISILGTTGLVRPYSHEAYSQTVSLCVKSQHLLGGTEVVFCTGGRTKNGAAERLAHLPESAFVCIGDFIAESLQAACRWNMRHVTVACMAGKLCKYAAGFTNTHAHKVRQDMDLLRREVTLLIPDDHALHERLLHCASVREALLLVPSSAHNALYTRLAAQALEHFAAHCRTQTTDTLPNVRIMLFDVEGHYLMEASS